MALTGVIEVTKSVLTEGNNMVAAVVKLNSLPYTVPRALVA
jgi:hypothetical protein